MWFRPGQVGDSDRFRVSSLKSRISKRKAKSDPTAQKGASSAQSTESINLIDPIDNPTKSTPTPTTSVDEIDDIPPCPPPRKNAKNSTSSKDSKDKDKEKILLTDRKFKNNRITKSSSKSKITDLEKQKSPRKISAPPILDTKQNLIVPPKKNVRSHSNLNLNALLNYKNYITSSNKRLSSEDFERLRRKSLSESSNLNKAHSLDVESNLEKNVMNGNGGNTSENEVFDEPPPLPPPVKKPSSNSLTSRVAAKISEASSSAKAKKAQKKKNRKGRRPSDIRLDVNGKCFVC